MIVVAGFIFCAALITAIVLLARLPRGPNDDGASHP